jgi:hypothetical protein
MHIVALLEHIKHLPRVQHLCRERTLPRSAKHHHFHCNVSCFSTMKRFPDPGWSSSSLATFFTSLLNAAFCSDVRSRRLNLWFHWRTHQTSWSLFGDHT